VKRRQDPVVRVPPAATYAVAGPSFWHLRAQEQPVLLDRYAAVLAANEAPFGLTLLGEPRPPLPEWSIPARLHRCVYLHDPSEDLQRGLRLLGLRLQPVAHDQFARRVLRLRADTALVHEHPGHLRQQDVWMRLYVLHRWPEQVNQETFRHFSRTDVPFALSLRFEPFTSAAYRRHLRRIAQAAATDMAVGGELGKSRGQRTRRDLASMQAALQERRIRLYTVTGILVIFATSRAELEQHSAALVSALEQGDVEFRLPLFRQTEALLRFLGAPGRRWGRFIDSAALSRLYWFAYADASDICPELAVGVDLSGPQLYVSRRVQRPNPAQFILGQPGSGKSAFAKVQLLRHLRSNPAGAVIIDPEGEYRALVDELASDGRGQAVLRTGTDVPWEAVGEVIESNHARGVWTHLTVDEAHLLLNQPLNRQRLRGWIKRARKWGVLFTAITQNVHDVLASAEGRTLLANAGEVLLFRQSPLDLDPLCRIFRLSDRHRDFLASCEPGECLFVDERTVVPVRVLLREDERPLVDTKVRAWTVPPPR
jgi:hypothetical protein